MSPIIGDHAARLHPANVTNPKEVKLTTNPKGIQPAVARLFSPEECAEMLEALKGLEPVMKDATSYVASVDFELPCTGTLRDRVRCFMERENDQRFNFQLSALEDPLIVAVSSAGAESPWHQDYQFYGDTDRTKLSASILLQPPDAGGTLEFMDIEVPPPQIGEATVFPAFLTHRVTPVTGGTRIVLVAFMDGSPFR